MDLSLPPPIAGLLEEFCWLREDINFTENEFVERLQFPVIMSSEDDLGTFPDRLRCSFPSQSAIPIEALKREVTNLLRKCSHPCPDWFAGLLVALVAVIRNRVPHLSAAVILSRLLDSATHTTSWHYRVIDRQFTGPATFMSPHTVGPFWFGTLTKNELESKLAPHCLKRHEHIVERWSGCYAMRYRAESVSLWPIGVWSILFKTEGVLDGLTKDVSWCSAINAASQDYFVRMHLLIENSSIAFLRRLVALCALHGSRSIDPAMFRNSQIETCFTLFSAMEPHAPLLIDRRKPMSWIAEVNRSITPLNDAMRTKFRDDLIIKLASMETAYHSSVQKYKSSRLHPLVSGFVDRLGSAHAHSLRHNNSAAFLDFVIAIEILFSEKEGTTDAVSGRTSTLVALISSQQQAEVKSKLDSVRKEMRRLYGVRSNFVHRGVEISENDLAALRSIVECLTPVALRWNDRATTEDEQMHLGWLRLVDYTRETIEMNRPVPTSDMFSIGVIEAIPENGGLRLG